jgi:hypothetical protein
MFDQMGHPLSADIPLDEDWQSQVDYGKGADKATWSATACGTDGCGDVPPTNWIDQLAFAQTYASGTTATGICDLPTYNDPNRLGNLSPDPVAPILPGGECSTPIMKNLNGGFWVGSPTPGDGVQVQSNDWGLYLDNGVHLKFNSPP